MKYDGLLFDLDGTMWDATENIRLSWNIAIKKFDELKNREITIEELQGVMGLPMDEIVKKFFPEFSREKQLEILEECCQVENEYLMEHGGILYPMLENTLKQLSKNHKLCIVSNGQAGYIQTFLHAHKLSRYFTDYQNWGDNQVSKGENIKIVMERNQIKKAAYVGDTQGDAKAAKEAGIDFIFARYGFGNVEEYDYIIDEFKQLSNKIL
ncbi:MAG: HAD family hydrolase [Lachnospiraceae bacterium]|nr:HAD family hydrolase [Lachnospiraceae bacterium]